MSDIINGMRSIVSDIIHIRQRRKQLRAQEDLLYRIRHRWREFAVVTSYGEAMMEEVDALIGPADESKGAVVG